MCNYPSGQSSLHRICSVLLVVEQRTHCQESCTVHPRSLCMLSSCTDELVPCLDSGDCRNQARVELLIVVRHRLFHTVAVRDSFEHRRRDMR